MTVTSPRVCLGVVRLPPTAEGGVQWRALELVVSVLDARARPPPGAVSRASGVLKPLP